MVKLVNVCLKYQNVVYGLYIEAFFNFCVGNQKAMYTNHQEQCKG